MTVKMVKKKKITFEFSIKSSKEYRENAKIVVFQNKNDLLINFNTIVRQPVISSSIDIMKSIF